jgi:ABC-2 type transport system ATP-binding protein
MTTSISGPAIQAQGLTKRFGDRTVVDGIDLEVPRGCAFGFLGPNGAGKTTFIRALLGLTPRSGGTARVLGYDMPAERRAALARVGAIVETPSFQPDLSGRENLRVAAAARGGEARDRIEPALARVGLGDRAGDRVKRYSLGMRQRLGIARCLLADPELLILDEPANGLDPAGILEFRLLMRGLVEEEGRTVFLSSHLLDEVEKTCDMAAIIDRGRVVTQGSITELAGEGRTPDVVIGCADLPRALALLRDHCPEVRGARIDGDALRVELVEALHAAGAVNELLVRSGISVWRIEPVETTLEQRFLELTTRLGVAA